MLRRASASGVKLATNPRAKSSAERPKAQRIPLAPGAASDYAGPGRSDIADHLGLTVETVSRTLSRLKKSGFISLADAHHITIVEPDALSEIAEGF